MKPTRCTNFSNLFLEWNSTLFRQFLCPSSGVFHCTHSSGICRTGLLTACKQDQDVPSCSYLQAVSKPVWHTPLLCVQRKTPDDGQRNCPKHVEFHSKNKFEKLVHLVGFIVRNLLCTLILVKQYVLLHSTVKRLCSFAHVRLNVIITSSSSYSTMALSVWPWLPCHHHYHHKIHYCTVRLKSIPTVTTHLSVTVHVLWNKPCETP